jgi:hypothetical protein
MHHSELDSIDGVAATWATWSRVIAVDNGAAQWRTLKEGQNGGWSVSKRKKKKI